MTNLHKLLIIDDEWNVRDDVYNNLFTKIHPGFNWPSIFTIDFLKEPRDISSIQYSKYDAVVVDINLDKFSISLTDALNAIGSSAPVILATQRAHEQDISARVLAQVNNPKAKIIHSLDLGALNTGNAHERDQVAITNRSLVVMSLACHKTFRATHSPGLDMDLIIAHISDTQYGDPSIDSWASFVEEHVADFIIDKYNRVDFVALTGDITYSGKSEEYDLASHGITKFIKRLWGGANEGERRRVIMVPGNHDVDFRLSGKDELKISFNNDSVILTHEPLPSRVISPPGIDLGLFQFRRFAAEYFNNDSWLSDDSPCWFDDSFLHLGIRFVVLNSASIISCSKPSMAALKKSCMEKIMEKYEKAHRDTCFTIAILHHGPRDLLDKKVSTIDNWAEVSNFLSGINANMLLHGHGHRHLSMLYPFGNTDDQTLDKLFKSAFSGECQVVSGDRFIRSMAPTTHLGEKLRPPDERRGFNVIRMIRRKGATAAAFDEIKITSYALFDHRPIQTKCVKFKFEH